REAEQPRPPLPSGLSVSHDGAERLSGRWVGDVAPLIAWLAQCPVRDVSITPPDLEDLFLAYYTLQNAEEPQ
ncbi:MAG: hypothetical protein KKB50_03635, partial [Planctomycetes bacterium]|nr:hypothetical protein [Planctomycetota bacterium]